MCNEIPAPPRLFQLLALARQNLLRAADRAFARELDTPGAQVVGLFAIQETPNCQLKDMARLLQVQNSAVTGLAARMEDNGLIERQPSPDDGRAVRLRLTAKGTAVVERATPLLRGFNTRLTADFTADELAVIARFLAHAAALDFPPETHP